MMFKRIEFTLNMEDPDEAALYRALRPSLRGRRAGTVIRQALTLLYAERLGMNGVSANRSRIPWRENDDEI